uniref:Uncharacterized protein n=1 Tax=Rhizophora mucronata TaxID=61149 RepID=A0A2P2QFF1_RHIMU
MRVLDALFVDLFLCYRSVGKFVWY